MDRTQLPYKHGAGLLGNRYMLNGCLFATEMGSLYQARDTQAGSQNPDTHVLIHFFPSQALGYAPLKTACARLQELGKTADAPLLAIRDCVRAGTEVYFVLAAPRSWTLKSLPHMDGLPTYLHEKALRITSQLAQQGLVKEGLLTHLFLVTPEGELHIPGTVLATELQKLQGRNADLLSPSKQQAPAKRNTLPWQAAGFTLVGIAVAGSIGTYLTLSKTRGNNAPTSQTSPDMGTNKPKGLTEPEKPAQTPAITNHPVTDPQPLATSLPTLSKLDVPETAPIQADNRLLQESGQALDTVLDDNPFPLLPESMAPDETQAGQEAAMPEQPPEPTPAAVPAEQKPEPEPKQKAAPEQKPEQKATAAPKPAPEPKASPAKPAPEPKPASKPKPAKAGPEPSTQPPTAAEAKTTTTTNAPPTSTDSRQKVQAAEKTTAPPSRPPAPTSPAPSPNIARRDSAPEVAVTPRQQEPVIRFSPANPAPPVAIEPAPLPPARPVQQQAPARAEQKPPPASAPAPDRNGEPELTANGMTSNELVKRAYAAIQHGRLDEQPNHGATYFIRLLNRIDRGNPQVIRLAREVVYKYHQKSRHSMLSGMTDQAASELWLAGRVIKEFNLVKLNAPQQVLEHRLAE